VSESVYASVCIYAYLHICVYAGPALLVLRGLPCAAHPPVCSVRVHSFLSKKTECGGAGEREEGSSERVSRTREGGREGQREIEEDMERASERHREREGVINGVERC
jgi:hypothetical protein